MEIQLLPDSNPVTLFHSFLLTPIFFSLLRNRLPLNPLLTFALVPNAMNRRLATIMSFRLLIFALKLLKFIITIDVRL